MVQGPEIATEQQRMTDEQRKSVALEYFKRLDRGGDCFELFAEDARVYFPKWGVSEGKGEIEKLFGDVGSTLSSIENPYKYFNCMIVDDTVVVEGTSHGATAGGVEWWGGVGSDARGTLLRRLRDSRRQDQTPLYLPRP